MEDLLRELGRIRSIEGEGRAQAIAKLPDAVIWLAPMPAPTAKILVREFGFQLLAVPFGEAFCLDRLNPANHHGVASTAVS